MDGKGSSRRECLGAGATCSHCSLRCIPMAPDDREGHRLHIPRWEGVVAGAWPGAWESPCSCCSGAEERGGGGALCPLPQAWAWHGRPSLCREQAPGAPYTKAFVGWSCLSPRAPQSGPSFLTSPLHPWSRSCLGPAHVYL